MGEVINGRGIAKGIRADLKTQLELIREELKRSPKLVALQIGENEARRIYINSQRKVAQELGVDYELITFEEGISQAKLLKEIEELNKRQDLDGLILLDPLPEGFDKFQILSKMDPAKDVEGIHPINLGKLMLSKPHLVPCTAQAVVEILDSIVKDYTGKEVVIVGHSAIVGKPTAMLLVDKLATIHICHIGTSIAKRLKAHLCVADILIVAVGKAELIKGEWIKEGAIVIDVGINKVGDKIVGDVEFDKALSRASYITPVPGGVGPVTTAMLFRNLIKAIKGKGALNEAI
jgi:methylenetetrahydrofolate dehydrogenase (NADP+)/methenyltetrahydrofolate cyclohydrolase